MIKMSLLHLRDVEWCYREVERQHDLSAEHVSGMCEALIHARMVYPKRITEQFIQQLSFCSKGIGQYRSVNLMSPPNTVEWEKVPQGMTSLVSNGQLLSAAGFIKEFLTIRPFVDGNGRVAALLFNYRLGCLASDHLVPLPNWEVLCAGNKDPN
jgi:hypothetical protein